MTATYLNATRGAQWSDTRQPALYGSMSGFLFIANAAYFARLFCQWKIARPFRIDDALLALATLLADAIIALFLLATCNGFGLHVFRVIAEDHYAPQKLVAVTKYIFITSFLSVACLASIKLALLFFYRRVFLVQQRWLTIAWWSNLVYIVLWFFGAFFFFIFECSPPSFYWTRHYAAGRTASSKPQGSCDPNSLRAITAILVLSLISDVALLTLPGGTISGLQVSRRRKLTLEAVFGLGTIAVAVSIGRIVLIVLPGDDPTYSIVDFMILTSAEQVTGILCACGPIIILGILRCIRPRKTRPAPGKGQRVGPDDHWAQHQEQMRRARENPLEWSHDGTTMVDVRVDPQMSSLDLNANPCHISVRTEVLVRRS